MDRRDPLSIAALVSHPIQYQTPLFRHIDDVDGIDLTVYYCDQRGIEPMVDPGFEAEIVWDQPLLEGYDSEFLNNWRRGAGGDALGDLNPGIVTRLFTTDHDVLWVHGYASITNWLGMASAKLLDIPVMFRGEPTPFDTPSGVKRLVIGALLRVVSGYGVIGSLNREFYLERGVNPGNLFHAPYSVDNSFFQEERAALPDEETLRDELGLSKDSIVLFVGKLVKRKRPGVLLDAFTSATSHGEATLLFVGDGKQRRCLERRAKDSDREDDIKFAGFQNQGDLPQYYEAADLFVLPSESENWGLVVNEAMNFELPIVTTDAVGCAADLVDKSNGRVVPVDDVPALSQALEDLLTDPEALETLGEQSLKKIDEWGIEETAEGIVEAATKLAGRRGE